MAGCHAAELDNSNVSARNRTVEKVLADRKWTRGELGEFMPRNHSRESTFGELIEIKKWSAGEVGASAG